MQRVVFILSLVARNALTAISMIISYSSSFHSMHHFDHGAHYSFELVLTFNILFAFSSLCIDINIIDHRTYKVIAHKLLFLGIFHDEMFKIEEVHGQWIHKKYTFAHPVSLSPPADQQTGTESGVRLSGRLRGKSPIGVWQKLILFLFVIGMLGSAVFTIYGIQQMTPYIEH